MPKAERGEIWLVDMGMAANTRPVAIINILFRDDERAVFAIIPHATALPSGRFEVKINLPWSQPGAFDVQGLQKVPGTVFLRRLSMLDPSQLNAIIQTVKVWLGAV